MAIDVNLGKRLHVARKHRGLTLRTVAEELGVSASLISQVENGHVQPSVSTLYALVTLLDVSLDSILGSTPSKAPQIRENETSIFVLQRSEDTPTAHMGDGVTWERLAHDPSSDSTSGYLVTYEQHDGNHGAHTERLQHAGTESCLILQGELALYVGDSVHNLRPGDSVHFDSMMPHLYVNHGREIVRGVWHVSGHIEHVESGK
jgi:transcriptional regulator with XRE-family HTH domain